MKTVQLLAVAALSFTSISLTAQQVGASASGQQNVSATAGRSQVNGSSDMNTNGSLNGGDASANGAADGSASASGPRGGNASASSANGAAAGVAEMRPVRGELEKSLDAKKAKPGDPVIVKTTQKMRTADGVELPKGTRLIGHVTEAQAHAKGHANSALGIAFDRAELRGGQTIPIHSMIESIAPPPSEVVAAAMANNNADARMGGGMMGGPAGGGAAMGGANLVGDSGATVGVGSEMAGSGVENTAANAARIGRETGAAANGALDATGRVAGSSAGMLKGQTKGALAGGGALAAHATGIPGVMLSGDTTGAAAGMLTANNRNVHLDSGTQMVLGIAAAAQ